MNGTQKLLVYEQFWNPAGLVLEIPWLELNLPARKWLSNGSWLGPSETLASSESSFYMKGLRGSHFLSLLPISRIFGVQRPPCIFTSLSLSVQVDQVPADIFLKLWIFFESYSEASFFIFFQILINDLINDSCGAGDLGLIHGSGRSTGEGNGNPFSILAWEITWTEEPCGLQSIGSQGVRHDWATNTFTLPECPWFSFSLKPCHLALFGIFQTSEPWFLFKSFLELLSSHSLL